MTKRRNLVRILRKNGFVESGGANHSCFEHADGRFVFVPRHMELKLATARGGIEASRHRSRIIEGTEIAMRQYRYEFEIYEEDGWWLVLPLGMDGATQGRTRTEAVDMACDWFRMMAEHAEIRGIDLPKVELGLPLQHGGERLLVSLFAGRETIDTVSAGEAAQMLGVSPARVSNLVKQRKLEGWHEGRNARVTRESVLARMKTPKSVGGRPRTKKRAATAML